MREWSTTMAYHGFVQVILPFPAKHQPFIRASETSILHLCHLGSCLGETSRTASGMRAWCHLLWRCVEHQVSCGPVGLGEPSQWMDKGWASTRIQQTHVHSVGIGMLGHPLLYLRCWVSVTGAFDPATSTTVRLSNESMCWNVLNFRQCHPHSQCEEFKNYGSSEANKGTALHAAHETLLEVDLCCDPFGLISMWLHTTCPLSQLTISCCRHGGLDQLLENLPT